ncbi:MAG: MinD/ParA family protein [Haloferacaceae archaeon]
MLAIAGGKGGVGKTTTALGLARALDGPVSVVDADTDMPDLHLLAGVDRDPTLAAVADGDDPAAVASPWPGEPSVAVVPAPTGTDADRDVAPALARLSGGHGRVVVDCPGGAGPDAATALRAADAALLVATRRPAALRDAAKTAEMARAVGTDLVGAVLTRSEEAPDAAARLFGCPVFGPVPDVDPPVLPRASVCDAYAQIVREAAKSQACENI